jgi:N utilization substance protein A
VKIEIETLKKSCDDQGLEFAPLLEKVKNILIIVYKTFPDSVDYPTIVIDDKDGNVSILDEYSFGKEDITPAGFEVLATNVIKKELKRFLYVDKHHKSFNLYNSRIGEIVSGVIMHEGALGTYHVEIDGNFEAILPSHEQIPREKYNHLDRLRFLITNVSNADGKVVVVLSRTHPNFLKKLFELEAPEVENGEIEIIDVVREAGSRSKLSVKSNVEKINPVGALIGAKGRRINAVSNELRGEKIDIILYDEEPTKYIASALSPAKVDKVEILDESIKSYRAYVPVDQLSPAIGKDAQNVRLAVRLVSMHIDIKATTAEVRAGIQV